MLIVKGATADEVQNIMYRSIAGYDKSFDLRRALARRMAWAAKSRNGFILETDDPQFLDPEAQEVVLLLDDNTGLTAPILYTIPTTP